MESIPLRVFLQSDSIARESKFSHVTHHCLGKKVSWCLLNSLIILGMLSQPGMASPVINNTGGERSGKITAEQLDMDNVGQAMAMYLVQHPEFLVAASETLRQQQKIAQQQAMAQAVLGQLTGLLHSVSTPSFGPEKAPVAVVAFVDFRQPESLALIPRLVNLSSEHPQGIRVIIKGLSLPGGVDNNHEEEIIVAGMLIRKDRGEVIYKTYLSRIADILSHDTPDKKNVIAATIKEFTDEVSLPDFREKSQKVLKDDLTLAGSLGLTRFPALLIIPRNGADLQNTTVLTERINEDAISQGVLRAGL